VTNDVKVFWTLLVLLLTHFGACAGGWALTHVVWR
jgi:hypothetical protein